MSKGREFLDKIYALEEDSDVRSFYDDAADQYDEILLSQIGYVSPTICARAITPYLPNREEALMDLGCGTGLAGEALSALGYTHIDGVDFSPEMLTLAKARNCYSKLALADLNAHIDIPSRHYAAAICVGVLGQHVLPAVLDEMIRIVEPAGVVCFSVNERAFDGYGFRDKVDALSAEGIASCLSLTKEAYHVHENIDGWVCLLRTSETADDD